MLEVNRQLAGSDLNCCVTILHIYVCVYTRACMRACVCVCVYIHVHAYMCACMHVCVHLCDSLFVFYVGQREQERWVLTY